MKKDQYNDWPIMDDWKSLLQRNPFVDVSRKNDASTIRIIESFLHALQNDAIASELMDVDVSSDCQCLLVDVEFRNTRNRLIGVSSIELTDVFDAKHPVIAICLPLVKVVDIDIKIVTISLSDVDMLYHFVCLQSVWFGFIFLIDIYIISYFLQNVKSWHHAT